jgi:hypothetical protein
MMFVRASWHTWPVIESPSTLLLITEPERRRKGIAPANNRETVSPPSSIATATATH